MSTLAHTKTGWPVHQVQTAVVTDALTRECTYSVVWFDS